MGITKQQIMYAITPAPDVKNARSTVISLTRVESRPKYSPIPPHTPAIFYLYQKDIIFSPLLKHLLIYFIY